MWNDENDPSEIVGVGGVSPRCDICGRAQQPDDDWNGETGNHRECETDQAAGRVNADALFVIFSAEEASAGLGWEAAGFWNNENGWGHLSTATVFTLAQTRTLSLPFDPEDAEWITLPRLNAEPEVCPCGNERNYFLHNVSAEECTAGGPCENALDHHEFGKPN